MTRMESVLSEFIAHTGADPGLAQDILEGQQWDLAKSLQAYYFLRGITASSLPILATCMATNGSPKMQPDITEPARAEKTERVSPQNGVSESPSSSVTSSPSKPQLQKADAVDLDDANKKLSRGISRATENINLVSKARNEFALDFRDSSSNDLLHDFVVETPVYTFTLPDFTIYPKDFVAFLEKDLIETSTLVSLEQAGRLNWWTESGTCQRLWPLATTGDGNCLLHAASLGMWGFHDRLLTLRKALHATLTKGPYRAAIWRRWRWQQTLQNKEAGLVYSEDEWQKEWTNLLRLSSTEPRSVPGRRSSLCDGLVPNGRPMRGIGILEPVMEHDGGGHHIYESLEEIHVLALAHVLRRPIIVVADTVLKDVTGEPFAPIPFGGVYLPFECRPAQCHRSPLVLTYDAAHFSALVAMEREAYVDKAPQPAAVIPLTDSEHRLLPLQFAVDPGEHFDWGTDDDDPKVLFRLALTEDDVLTLLSQYLNVERVPWIVASTSDVVDAERKSSSGGSFESDEGTETGGSSSSMAGGALLAAPRSSSSSSNKASKQLQSVAKQFGSIGRSMGRKLRRNLGNFKLGRSNSCKESPASSSSNKDSMASSSQLRHTLPPPSSASGGSRTTTYILAARLDAERRHEYQEEMLKNYLQSARTRYVRTRPDAAASLSKVEDDEDDDDDDDVGGSGGGGGDDPVRCVNVGCKHFGTVASSYLCSACFEKQKQQLRDNTGGGGGHRQGANYGIGRSRFYADAEPIEESSSSSLGNEDATKSLPNLAVAASAASSVVSRKPSLNPDQTLYLSNSTFYNDVNTPPTAAAAAATRTACQTPKCPFYGTPEFGYYCSQCHKEQKMRKANTFPRLVDQMQTTHI